MLLLDPTPEIKIVTQKIAELMDDRRSKPMHPQYYRDQREAEIVQGLKLIACQLLPTLTHGAEWEPMLPPRQTSPASAWVSENHVRDRVQGVVDHPFWFRRPGLRRAEDYLLVTFPYDRWVRPVGSVVKIRGTDKKNPAVSGQLISVIRVDDGWGLWFPGETAVYVSGAAIDPYPSAEAAE